MVVGEFTQETQLVVIGGGPGGYSAAFRAAELGIETVLVDSRDAMGGVCLHEGCIPSKTLLHIVETLHRAEHAKTYGLHYDQPRIDHDAVRSWVQQSVSTLAKGLLQLCKKHGVEYIQGRASFEDGRRLVLRDAAIPRIRFRRAVIATGTVSKSHPKLNFDGRHIISPQQALALTQIPEKLLIVGCNYNAVELAAIYQALGSAVTLVDEGDALLPDADTDLVRPLTRRLNETLAGVHLGTSITNASVKDKSVHITFAGDKAPDAATFDQVIVSLGYDANVESLGLENTSVTFDDDGFIRTDDQQRTGDGRIFAAGNVTGGVLLADRALAQGRVAAEVVAGWNTRLDNRAVPVAVYCDPQIAWCGVTEAQAKAQGMAYEVTKQPWGASGRAVGMGRTEGMSKILYDPDTQLVLGMGICGPQATEIIAQGALAIEMGAVLTDLAATVHPHPTLSEMLNAAAQRVETPDDE